VVVGKASSGEPHPEKYEIYTFFVERFRCVAISSRNKQEWWLKCVAVEIEFTFRAQNYEKMVVFRSKSNFPRR